MAARFKEVIVGGNQMFMSRIEGARKPGVTLRETHWRLKDAMVEGEPVALIGIGVNDIAAIMADREFVSSISNSGAERVRIWAGPITLSGSGLRVGEYSHLEGRELTPGIGYDVDDTILAWGHPGESHSYNLPLLQVNKTSYACELGRRFELAVDVHPNRLGTMILGKLAQQGYVPGEHLAEIGSGHKGHVSPKTRGRRAKEVDEAVKYGAMWTGAHRK
jgi:hypothetical protein